MSAPLKLYVKVWCPWCVMAEDFLKGRGYQYEQIDVERDRAAFEEMFKLSGQRLTPTLVVGGKVLPDFGPEELDLFLKQHSITP
jgi:glutaredoxin